MTFLKIKLKNNFNFNPLTFKKGFYIVGTNKEL